MFEEYKNAFEKEERRKKAQQSSGNVSKVVFRWPSFISEKYQESSEYIDWKTPSIIQLAEKLAAEKKRMLKQLKMFLKIYPTQ